MRSPRLRPTIPLTLTLTLAFACGGDDGTTGAETGDHDHDHDHETSASASASAGSGESGTSASTTASTSGSGSSSEASGGSDGTTGSTSGADSGSGSETGHADLDAAWCECMLTNCHDVYHATWGEDHVAAEAMCLAAAAEIPANGAETMSGNFIECRLYFCEQAAGDEALCDNAIGNAVCI